MSATCHVIATSVPGARCPDYAIRIKCECPPTTTTESTTSIRTATSRYSTVAPSPTILGGTAVVNVTTGNIGTIVNVASTAASPTILGGTAVSNVTTGNIGTTVNVASTASAIDGGSTTNAGGMIKTTSGSWSGYDHGTGTVGYVSISGNGFHGNGSTLGNGTAHGFTSVDISSQTTSSSILNWLIPVIAGISFLAAFLILLLCIYKKKRKQVSDAQVDNM
ncbi:mucin-5B-like [Dreissena polymorpha]|uniref:Uncharacterized protein n=1 Tax=Dreissena polymorpha TaxID=45954 RepID=A0A9D4L793_DREPO|nr:mucin-5B-like [Dreissena polymorpha]XP_052272994.1 mucin-5B-like [Dreissena polymorpha]KAH3852861.1 hypothetical protein DPMN_095382 [Dreissena polymorpha]